MRSSFAALTILLALNAVPGWADAQADAKRSSQAVLEVYLDRAKDASSAQEWKSDSDWGLKAALAAWERGTTLWSAEGADLSAERQSVNDLLNETVVAAWQKWLVERFYQNVGAKDMAAIASAAQRADQQWLYQTDSQGNVVYDSKGDPIVLIKKTTAEDAQDAQWRVAMTGDRDALLASWDTRVQNALPELSALATPQDLAVLGPLAAQIGAAYRDRYKQELDILYQQQVARYTATRLYDQYSLKKKSAEETAGSLVDQLIADVRDGTDEGIQRVRTSLGLNVDSVNANDQVSVEAWEASFQQVLTSGLAKWDIAEKKLLGERADWESRAGTAYQDSEKVWAAAYEKLVQEQTSWQNQLKQILAQGRAQWQDKQQALTASIDTATQELDKQIGERLQSKQDQMSAMVDVYSQFQNLVETSQTSGQYWFDRLLDPEGHGNDTVYDWTPLNNWATSRIDTLTTQAGDRVTAARSQLASLDAYIARASQLDTSDVAQLYPQYRDVLTVQMETVNFSNPFGDDSEYQVLKSWSFHWAGAPGLYSQNLNDFVALRNTLNSQLTQKIADQNAITATRSTIGNSMLSSTVLQTIVSIEQTLGHNAAERENWSSNYQEAAYWLLKKKEYGLNADDARDQLKAGLAQVIGTQNGLNSVLGTNDLETGYLDEYQVALLKAQIQAAYWDREYDIAQKVWTYATQTTSERPTAAQQQAAYDAALADYGLKKNAYTQAVAALTQGGTDVTNAQKIVDTAQEAIDAARDTLEKAQQNYSIMLSASQSGVNEDFYTKQITNYAKDLALIYGLTTDPDSSTKSLTTTLASYRAALQKYGYGQVMARTQSQLKSLVLGTPGVSPSLAELRTNAIRKTAQEAFVAGFLLPSSSEYAAGAQAALTKPSAAAYAAYYEAFVAGEQTALLQREAQLRLLLSSSDQQWYTAQTGRTGTGQVAADLEADRNSATGELLRDRLSLMADTWAHLETPSANPTPATLLLAGLITAQGTPSTEQKHAWSQALATLVATGTSQNWWANPTAHAAEIRSALAGISDPGLRDGLKAIMGGQSGLSLVATDSTHDALSLLTSGTQAQVMKVNTLSSIFGQFRTSSLGNLEAEQTAALGKLKTALAAYGGSSSDLGASLNAILTSVGGWQSGAEQQASQLVARIRALEPSLRSDVADAAEQVAQSILQYAALKAPANSSVDQAEITALLDAKDAELAQLGTLGEKMQGQGVSPQASVKQLVDVWTWAASKPVETVSAALKSKLEAALTKTLAAQVAEARLAATGTDEAAQWEQAWTTVTDSLALPSALKTSVMTAAKALDTRLKTQRLELYGTLAQLSGLPGFSGPIDTANLAAANAFWSWANGTKTGLGRTYDESKAADYVAALTDPAEASLATKFFQALKNGQATSVQQVFDALEAPSTKAVAQAAWDWLQSSAGLNGHLVASTDVAYALQQTKVVAYLGSLSAGTEKNLATLLLQNLQAEVDSDRTNLDAVLTQLLGATPAVGLTRAWDFYKAPVTGVGTTLLPSTDAGFTAQMTLMQSYLDSLTDPHDQLAVAGWMNAWQASADGGNPDGKSVLADLLAPDLHTTLLGVRGSGPLAQLQERALAMSLNDRLSASEYALLADLSGIQTYGSLDQSLFDGYVGTDAAVNDVVTGWWAKSQYLSGNTVSTQTLGHLSAAAQADVTRFQQIAQARDGFLGGIDASIESYVSGLSNPAIDSDLLTSVLRQGTWDDDFFWADAVGQGADDAALLEMAQSWTLSQLDTLLPQLQDGLSKTIAAKQEERQVLTVRAEFRAKRKDWNTRIANEDVGYRQYLAKLKDGEGKEVVSNAIGLSVESDAVLSHAAAGQNLELQAYNDFARQAAALQAAASTAATAGVFTAFQTRYAHFADTADAAVWNDGTDIYHIEQTVIDGYQKAAGELGQLRGQEANDQAEILKLGRIRALIETPPSNAALTTAQTAITTAKTAFQAAQTTLDTAMDGLQAKMLQYNQTYLASNTAYEAAEAARYAFETQDQLLTYAQNGYLLVSDDALKSAGYQSPTDLRDETLGKKNRANEVLDLLTKLTSSGQPERNVTTPDGTPYTTSASDLLNLDKLQDQLELQISRQTKVVEVRHGEYEAAYNPFTAYNAVDFSESDANEWKNYIVYDASLGTLKLNVDANFVVTARASNDSILEYTKADHWDELKTDTQGKYYVDQKDMTLQMAQWAATDPSGYQARLKTWGLAMDYMMLQIHANKGSLDDSKLMEKLGLKDFVKGTDNALDDLVLDSNLKNDIQGKSNNNNFTYLDDYREWLRGEMLKAYQSVVADTTHWRLFQNALSQRLTGNLQNTQYFDSSIKQKANEYLNDETQDSADSHRDSRNVLAGIAAGYTAAGVAALASLFGAGGAPYFFTMAGIFAALAWDQNNAAEIQQGAADKTHDLVKSNQTLIYSALQISQLQTISGAWTTFSQQNDILVTLKGTPATGQTSLTKVQMKDALRVALAKSANNPSLALDPASGALIDKYWGLISASDKDSAQNALSAMVRRARNDQNNAGSTLDGSYETLQTQFLADQALYEDLQARYLNGDTTVTKAQVQDQATKTYQNAKYAELARAKANNNADVNLINGTSSTLSAYESDRSALVGRIAQTIVSLEQVRLEHLRTIRISEWDHRQAELNRQKARWDNQMLATRVKAQQAWGDSFNKLNANYKTWQKTFTEEYQDKATTWAAVYNGFQADRRDWVDQVATNADQAQNEVWAISMGQRAEAGISRSALTLIGDLASGLTDTQSVLDQVMDKNQLGQYLAGAQRINNSLATVSTDLRTGLKFDASAVGVLKAIRQLQNGTNDELSLHAALIVAAQARDNLRAAQKSYREQVIGANENFEAGMDQTFLGSGFSKTGGGYTREVVIGSTAFETLHETQSLDGYKPFDIPGFETQTQLDDVSLKGLDSDGVQARVDVAMEELKDQAEAIFGTGKKNEDGTMEGEVTLFTKINGGDDTDLKGATAGHVTDYKDPDNKEKSDGRTAKQVRGAGTFGAHLGFAPEMKSNADLETKDLESGYRRSILIAGEGEQGRMIGWYQYYQMRAGKGWGELGQAFYNKKLWDDRGQAIKAPTVKAVAMTGVGIAATLMSGGAGGALASALISAGSTIAADAVFTMADVAHGADSGEAWGGFGKRALTTAATSAISFATAGLGDTLVGALGATGNAFGTAAIKAVTAGGIAATNRVVSTGIDSLNWEDGHIGFDEEKFGNAWALNGNNYAGIVGSMVSAGTASYVNSGGIGFLNSKLTDYNKVGNMVGALASTAVSYGMTGEASFNLANLSMFGLKDQGGNIASMGLLEMHIGGSDGLSFNMGSGGTDISAQAWQGFAQGLSVWDENAKINATAAKWQSDGLSQNMSVALRSLSSQKNGSSDYTLYEQLMNGTSTISENSGLNAVAETTLNGNGGRNITLGNNKLGSGGIFDMSVLLAHESMRDGVWNGEAGQLSETRGAAMNHMSMAAQINQQYSGGLSQNLADEGKMFQAFRTAMDKEKDPTKRQEIAAKFNSYVDGSYSSDQDFWKLISRSDGTHILQAEYDKNGNLIKDLNIEYQTLGENGEWETIGTDHFGMASAGSRGQALFQILGRDRAVELAGIADPAFLEMARTLKPAELEEQVGERLMKSQGMTFDDKTKKWTGSSSFTLTDARTDGYILFNNKGQGIYDRFTVSATLNRNGDSWDGVIGTGTPVTPQNKKGLDNIEFTKRTLEGKVVGSPYVLSGVQSVDVYAAERNQPYNSSFLNKTIQGNTVVSNFSMQVNAGDAWHYLTTQNAWTLDGDWINKYGTDGEPGGKWWLHAGTDFQTSDGCNIPSDAAYLNFKATMQQWGLSQNHEIYARMNDWRGFLIKTWGKK